MQNTVVPYINHADDVALLTTAVTSMQEQLDIIATAGGAIGLELGPTKCSSVHIRGDPKRKEWFVNSSHKFQVGGSDMKALEPIQTFKYLGLKVGPISRMGEPR